MKFINLEIIKQLKGIAIDFSKRKCKITMGQVFCIEITFNQAGSVFLKKTTCFV